MKVQEGLGSVFNMVVVLPLKYMVHVTLTMAFLLYTAPPSFTWAKITLKFLQVRPEARIPFPFDTSHQQCDQIGF